MYQNLINFRKLSGLPKRRTEIHIINESRTIAPAPNEQHNKRFLAAKARRCIIKICARESMCRCCRNHISFFLFTCSADHWHSAQQTCACVWRHLPMCRIWIDPSPSCCVMCISVHIDTRFFPPQMWWAPYMCATLRIDCTFVNHINSHNTNDRRIAERGPLWPWQIIAYTFDVRRKQQIRARSAANVGPQMRFSCGASHTGKSAYFVGAKNGSFPFMHVRSCVCVDRADRLTFY